MKTLRRFFPRAAVALVLLAAASTASARQQPPPPKVRLPQASPQATLTHTIGVTDLTIVYHRPSVRGRTIWGDITPEKAAAVLKASSFLPQNSPEGTLDGGQGTGKDFPMVPNGHVWRAGANEATKFTVTDDVLVNGQPLKAGTYSLHTIPGKDEWTIIFNSDAGQWGSFTYDEKKDVLRVKAKPETTADSQEWLAFQIEPEGENAARVNIRWERLRVPFTVEVKDVKALTVEKMRAAVAAAKADDWRTPLQAANYVFLNNLTANNEEALQWLEKSLKTKETFGNLYTKARVLAATGKSADAVAAAEKALQLAKAPNSGVDAPTIADLEKRMAEWKSKL